MRKISEKERKKWQQNLLKKQHLQKLMLPKIKRKSSKNISKISVCKYVVKVLSKYKNDCQLEKLLTMFQNVK